MENETVTDENSLRIMSVCCLPEEGFGLHQPEENLFAPPGRDVFINQPSNLENFNEDKLLENICEILKPNNSFINVNCVKKLLEIGLFNFQVDKDNPGCHILSRLLFSLMSIHEDKKTVDNVYNILRKKQWIPDLTDVLGVLLTWGATPETLDINPWPPLIVVGLSYHWIVNKLERFPDSYNVEKVLDFVVNTICLHSDNRALLIKILTNCAFDVRLGYQRHLITTGINNCLETFDEQLWNSVLIADIAKELNFEKEHFPNAVNICTQVLPRTKRGNDVSLQVSFGILRNISKSVALQKDNNLEGIYSLLQDCKHLWNECNNTSLLLLYHFVMLISDMVYRQNEPLDQGVLKKLKTELEAIKARESQRTGGVDYDIISFMEFISKIISDLDLLILLDKKSIIFENNMAINML